MLGGRYVPPPPETSGYALDWGWGCSRRSDTWLKCVDHGYTVVQRRSPSLTFSLQPKNISLCSCTTLFMRRPTRVYYSAPPEASSCIHCSSGLVRLASLRRLLVAPSHDDVFQYFVWRTFMPALRRRVVLPSRGWRIDFQHPHKGQHETAALAIPPSLLP